MHTQTSGGSLAAPDPHASSPTDGLADWEARAYHAAIPLLRAGASELAASWLLVRAGYATHVDSLFTAVDMYAAPHVGGRIEFGRRELERGGATYARMADLLAEHEARTGARR